MSMLDPNVTVSYVCGALKSGLGEQIKHVYIWKVSKVCKEIEYEYYNDI